MFIKKDLNADVPSFYEDICLQLDALMDDAPTMVSQLANASALLNVYLENINWVGFYLKKENELILGPFQGLPACTRIAIGKGVCGTAAQQLTVIRVEDVHQFPGHIACDGNSESEIVLPIIIKDQLIGVLDIDAPIKKRFTEADEKGLKTVVEHLSANLKRNA